MSLSERIKFIRGSMTQKEFASKIGASLGGVQSWESRDQTPSGKNLNNIRDVFDVNIDWLLTGRGEPYIRAIYDRSINAPERPDEPDLEDFKAIIKNFMDKKYASKINSNLVELENLSPESYREIGTYIQGVVDGIKMMSSANKPSKNTDRQPGENAD